MRFLKCWIQIFLCNVLANDDKNMKHYRKLNTELSGIFGNILKNLVEVNERRLVAINNLALLQEQKISINYLRTKDLKQEEKNSESDMPILLLLLTIEHKPKINNIIANRNILKDMNLVKQVPHRYDKKTYFDASKFMDNCGVNSRRRRKRMFCSKEAAKACKKSCLAAYRRSCQIFICPRRMRRKARTTCKSTCKYEFNKGKYDDTDTE